jgi:hypothetical protein
MTVPSDSLSAGSFVVPVASQEGIGLPWPATPFRTRCLRYGGPPALDDTDESAGRRRRRDKRTVSGSPPSRPPVPGLALSLDAHRRCRHDHLVCATPSSLHFANRSASEKSSEEGPRYRLLRQPSVVTDGVRAVLTLRMPRRVKRVPGADGLALEYRVDQRTSFRMRTREI